MKIRTSYLSLFLLASGLAYIMRILAALVRDESIIILSAYGVTILVASGLAILGNSLRKSAAFGCLASIIVITSFFVECMFETAATRYVWHRPGPNFQSDPEIYWLVACFEIFMCSIMAVVAAFLSKTIHDAIQRRNRKIVDHQDV